MEKNSFISNFKHLHRLPLGAIGAFVILASLLITSTAMLNLNSVWEYIYLYGQPVSDDAVRVEAKLHLMPPKKEKYRIFLIGSSQTREGFDVDYMNNRFSNHKAIFYNLGLSGDEQPIGMYMVTDIILPLKPDTIVYMPFIGSLYSDYNYDAMPLNFDPKIIPYFFKYVKPSKIISKGDIFIQSFIGKYISVYKYRYSLMRILKDSMISTLHGHIRTAPVLFAYQANRPNTYFDNQVIRADGKKYFEGDYTQFNKECFVLFAQDVINSGAKLIVIRGPTHPRLKECYPASLDSAFDDFFNSNAAEMGYTYISSSKMPVFTASDFVDFTHLNTSGRSKLSDFLGHNITNQ